VAYVARTKPDIIWVGMGTPTQDLFMAKYLPLLNTSVMIGVGAAFLYHTGRLRDSPRWVKQAGLQWVDRLIQEPRRLWKRYLVGNPKFIALLAMQLAGLKRYPLANSLSDGQ
jgi:N-acetylglucosaminyldiphosphoundecaprenol N-acetyl-beta-D-mannosaminyltransferase